MKKQRSRKGKALRWLLILAVTVAAMHFLNLYNFTPAAALRDRERELGCGPTQEISRRGSRPGPDLVLSGREDCLLVTEQIWDPLMGWRIDNSKLLHRDPEKPIQLEAHCSGNQTRMEMWLCGWVSEPRMSELKLRARCRQWYGTGEDIDVPITVKGLFSIEGWNDDLIVFWQDHIPATYTVREVWWENEQGEEILLWQN